MNTQLISHEPVSTGSTHPNHFVLGAFRLSFVNAALFAVSFWFFAQVWPGGLLWFGLLTVLITTHEAGHYLAGRAAGMRPTAFFCGLGPTVAVLHRNGCDYGLRLLPVGGFVKVPGMSAAETVDPDQEAGAFRQASTPGQLAMVAAGPAVNIATGVVLVAAATPAGVSPAGLAVGVEFMWAVAATTVDALVSTVVRFGDLLVAAFGDPDLAPARFLTPVSGSELMYNAGDTGLPLLAVAGVVAGALGVANLLPVPPLDGGHLVRIVGEKTASRVVGRPVAVPVRVLNVAALTVIGFFLVVTAVSVVLDLRAPVL
jgi:membrane-associated protease RseP (regulator of RpoE activity)